MQHGHQCGHLSLIVSKTKGLKSPISTNHPSFLWPPLKTEKTPIFNELY